MSNATKCIRELVRENQTSRGCDILKLRNNFQSLLDFSATKMLSFLHDFLIFFWNIQTEMFRETQVLLIILKCIYYCMLIILN